MPFLNNLFRPITAHPFKNDETYIEIEPCEALKPYICCFWGTPKSYTNIPYSDIKYGLVTPDTCMDIIFNMNLSENKIHDIFCGINDSSIVSQSDNSKSTLSCFAIRFNFWAVPLFSDDSMKEVLNAYVDVEAYFKNFRRELEPILQSYNSIRERAAAAEQYLLKKLRPERQNGNVMNSIYAILKSRGTTQISDLSHYTSVSQRQLERLFIEFVGLTPKKLSNLVRYQYLWRDIVYKPSFNIQDAVFKYRFTDQAHLLKEFKKYHSMTPAEGKALAYNNK